MLALRLPFSVKLSLKPLLLLVLMLIVTVTAVRMFAKIQKPSRTGEQSRTAFLRWRPQVLALQDGTDIYRAFNYPNPPIMAMILTPLMELPPLAGALAWFVLKAFLAVLMARMAAALIAEPVPPWAFALAIGLSLHPILGDLSHGNVNLFIAFLVMASLDLYRRGRDVSAGVVLALAIACKITPALFVALFIWKRSWKTLMGIGMGLGLWWWLAPGTVLGFDHNRTLFLSWFETMVKPFLVEGVITSEHANQSLPGLLTRLFTGSASFIAYSDEDGRPVTAAVHTLFDLGPGLVQVLVKGAMLVFVLFFVGVVRGRERCGLSFAAQCGLIVLGMLLFSERTWKHHATTLLLPMLVLTTAATRWRRFWWVVAAVPLLSLVPSALNEDSQDLALVYGVYTAMYVMLAAAMMAVVVLESRLQPVFEPAKPKTL